MAGLVPAGFSFERIEPVPLDISYVFDSVTDLETYLSGTTYVNPPFSGVGFPYKGQILAVLNGTNQPDVYVTWEVPSGTAGAIENELNGLFYAYSPVGAGGGAAAMPEPPADDQLYGRTRATGAATGAWEMLLDDGTY